MAALINHGVHGAGAAEDFPTRNELAPVVEAGLWNGLEIPIKLGVKQIGKAGRDMDIAFAIRTAGFQ